MSMRLEKDTVSLVFSYRWLWATKSSAKAASAPSHWAISPAFPHPVLIFNWAELKFTSEETRRNQELPTSNWLWTGLWRTVNCPLMWEGPVHSAWYNSLDRRHYFLRKLAEQEPVREPASSVLQAVSFCLKLLLEFPPDHPQWPGSIGGNELLLATLLWLWWLSPQQKASYNTGLSKPRSLLTKALFSRRTLWGRWSLLCAGDMCPGKTKLSLNAWGWVQNRRKPELLNLWLTQDQWVGTQT